MNAREPHWQRRAVQLARARTPFTVTNFNAARDGNFYFAIRSRHQLNAQIDYEAARASFQPSDAPAKVAIEKRLCFRIHPTRSGLGVKVDFINAEKAPSGGEEKRRR